MVVVIAAAAAAVAGVVARGDWPGGCGGRGRGRGGGAGGPGRSSAPGRRCSCPPPPPLAALSRRTTWIVWRIVFVRTSTVGVAVGDAVAATIGRGGEVGRAIAAAATPPSAESTARAATAGVRRLMPTPSDPAPQATGRRRQSFGKGGPRANVLIHNRWLWNSTRATLARSRARDSR